MEKLGPGWFIEDLPKTAEFATADSNTGRPAAAVKILTGAGDILQGNALLFVDEGGGKSSLVIRRTKGAARVVTSGPTNHQERKALAISFRR